MNISTTSNTLQIAKSQSFNVGDLVRVIDRDESSPEWAKFTIKERSFVLYELVPLDRPFLFEKRLYVFEREIVADSFFTDHQPMTVEEAALFLDSLFTTASDDFFQSSDLSLMARIQANFGETFCSGEIDEEDSYIYYINYLAANSKEDSLVVIERFSL